MIAPDTATRATLYQLMGCSAPWYGEPQFPIPAAETGFYQDETVRLLASTRRDVFLASIVFALAKRRMMTSAVVRQLLAAYEQRKWVCLDCVPRDSFAVWREIETALKLRVTSSAPSKALEKASKSKNEWIRSLPAADLEIVRPQTMSPNSHCRPAWQQQPKKNSDGSSPTTNLSPSSPSPLVTQDDVAAATTPFEVNIHMKCESYDRHQLLFSTFRSKMESVSTAKAELDASVETKDFAEFVRDRDALFKEFGLEDADRDFKAAERRESDRSRVDGGQHEYETASSGARRIAEILWENFSHNIAANHFHSTTSSATSSLSSSPPTSGSEERQHVTSYAPKCTRAIHHLTLDEFVEYFLASLCCTWSAVHERLASRSSVATTTATSSHSLPSAVSSNSVGGDEESDDSMLSATTSPAAPGPAAPPKPRVKPRVRVLDFSQNLERKMYHRRCRAAGIPHLVMITSAKYRCGTVCGEFDVTIMDVLNNELLLVVEAKASAGDLIKARDQKARLALVVDQLKRSCTTTTTATTDGPTSAVPPPPTGGAIDFSCAGTLLEWQWDAQQNMLRARDSVANTSQKQQQQQSNSSKNPGEKRMRQPPESSVAPVVPSCGLSIVRIKPEAIVSLPIVQTQGGSDIVWFAYCTSCSPGVATNKTPYYSSIAHMVTRSLSSELAAALLLQQADATPALTVGSGEKEGGDNSTTTKGASAHSVCRTLVQERLAGAEQVQDLVGSLNTRKITETVRRLWLAEMAKPTSSFLRPPNVLWQELEAMEFRDLILV